MIKEDSLDFILENTDYIDRERIREVINKHIEYGTYLEFRNNNKVVAIVRWNVNGCIAEVIDLIIRRGNKGYKIIKAFLVQSLLKFPYLKYIRFERHKYPDRKKKIYKINQILQVK